MRSAAGSFYDPYDWQPWPTPRRVRPVYLAIVIAVLVLMALIAADVAAYEAIPAKVTVTAVDWYVGDLLVGNESGFVIAGGHSVVERLECSIFCPMFRQVSVGAPFTLVGATIANPWFEYVNATIQAPDSAYQGPMALTLSVVPPPSASTR
jgi:hypothetical protein